MTIYEKLFGTPERAVRTLEALCRYNSDNTRNCWNCPICSAIESPCGDELAKLLDQEIDRTTSG